MSKFNPGSKEAIRDGCTCSVMDNRNGEGTILNKERVWWISDDCPMHNVFDKPTEEE